MKISPKKPQFFKPILPGFKHTIKIPTGFLKYLKGQVKHEFAVLRRAEKKWLVKLNGRRMEEGWPKFAEDHNLQLGDLLVFRHERNMEFEVIIFDSTHVDREYAEYVELQNEERDEETSKKFKLKEKPKRNIKTSHKAFSDVEAAKDMAMSPADHFTCTMTSHYISKCYVVVPKRIAEKYGLNNRICMITIKDKQRSWTFSLYSCSGATFIGGRWRKFCDANCVKEGDRVTFFIIANGEEPILKFQDLRGNVSLQSKGKKTNFDVERTSNRANVTKKKKKANVMPHEAFPNSAEAAMDMPNGHSHFVCTLRSYTLSRSFLTLPGQFARVNGLTNRRCTIMISDKQRSWTFSLYYSIGKTYIGGEWRIFCAVNCLQEGDRIMFELVSNGETPILKFHRTALKISDMTAHGAQAPVSTSAASVSEKQNPNVKRKAVPSIVEAATDLPLGRPHCICTIKSFNFSNCYLRLPAAFSRENGLSSRRCMIMITDKQRSWIFSLYSCSKNVTYIGGRWRNFCNANCLNEGDSVMFELVNNGEKPILKFQDLTGNTSPLSEGKTTNLDAKKDVGTSVKIETSDVIASTSAAANPYFVSTILPSIFGRSFFNLPMAFVKAYDLMNIREMTLIDDKRRSWSVSLGKAGRRFGIKKGWSRVLKTNDVQVGDAYKFELVNRGSTPTAYFHCKYSRKDAEHDWQGN